MTRMMFSALVFVLANAVGLFVASLVLGESFGFTFGGFIFATLLLSVVEAVAGPLIVKLSEKNVPALQGGVALVTTLVGLWITNLIVGGMHIAGIGTLLIASLVVWIAALIAGLVLPKVLAKKAVDEHRGK